MCLLCEHAQQQWLKATTQSDSSVLHGLSIAPKELIDNGSVEATSRFTSTDQVLDYYLHTPGGAVTVNGGGFGEQTIQSVAIPLEDQQFFQAMIKKLDTIIDLDFRESSIASGADVDLFYDTTIDLNGSENTLGLATTSGNNGWELFVKYPDIQNDENYRR